MPLRKYVLIFYVAGTSDHFEAPKQIQCVRGWRRAEPQSSRTIHNIPSKSSLGKTNNLSHFGGSCGRLHLKNYSEVISTYHIIRVSCGVIFLGMHAFRRGTVLLYEKFMAVKRQPWKRNRNYRGCEAARVSRLE